MAPESRMKISAALDRWKLARTIHVRLKSENSQNPTEFVQSVQNCISALDNLRTKMVEALDARERQYAEEQLADTVALSYLRTLDQCEDLLTSLRAHRTIQ